MWRFGDCGRQTMLRVCPSPSDAEHVERRLLELVVRRDGGREAVRERQARAVRLQRVLMPAICICMQIARVPFCERDGLGCVESATRRDAAKRTSKVY